MKKIELDFCFSSTSDNGKTWDLMIDSRLITESSIRDIKTQLRQAFELGMNHKAQEIRECLQIKEKITLI